MKIGTCTLEPTKVRAQTGMEEQPQTDTSRQTKAREIPGGAQEQIEESPREHELLGERQTQRQMWILRLRIFIKNRQYRDTETC